MRRRDFITVLSGAAATWPLAALAQQGRVPVVGYLHSVSPATQDANVAALRRGLGEQGLVEGRNYAIEYRFANNDYNRLPELTADLGAPGGGRNPRARRRGGDTGRQGRHHEDSNRVR